MWLYIIELIYISKESTYLRGQPICTYRCIFENFNVPNCHYKILVTPHVRVIQFLKVLWRSLSSICVVSVLVDFTSATTIHYQLTTLLTHLLAITIQKKSYVSLLWLEIFKMMWNANKLVWVHLINCTNQCS